MHRSGLSSRPAAIPLLAALWVLVVLAAVMLAVTASTAEAADAGVRLTTGATPASVAVGVGDTVTVRNDDGERHRLRARDPEDVDTGNIEPGEEAIVTFPVAGRYVLVDERSEDPAYELTVEVREPGAASAAPAGGATSSGGTSTADRPGGGAAAAPSSATVTIPDDVFAPRSVTIAAGGTVAWQNRDGDHTVTARDRSWDSGMFGEGDRYQRRFPDPGTYAYLCLLHSDMTGTVQVVGASAGPADAPTSSPSPEPSPVPSSRVGAPAAARAAGDGSESGGSLPMVAAIMLLFMGITFTIGRVSSRG